MLTAEDLVLSETLNWKALTKYARPGQQLEELHRRGFHRARRARDGSVVLERAHYEAVCAGGIARREPEVMP